MSRRAVTFDISPVGSVEKRAGIPVRRRSGADTLNKKHVLSKVPGGNRRSELFEGTGINSQYDPYRTGLFDRIPVRMQLAENSNKGAGQRYRTFSEVKATPRCVSLTSCISQVGRRLLLGRLSAC